jgi:hypothetical protein
MTFVSKSGVLRPWLTVIKKLKGCLDGILELNCVVKLHVPCLSPFG